MHLKAWHIPVRVATGVYILNSGLGKRGTDEAAAAGMHGWPSSAIPPLGQLDPPTFARALSAGEMALGAALLMPFIPSWVAGVGLTAFSSGLLRLYQATPHMTEDDGIRPSEQGVPLAKDIWMLGIGLALIVDRLTDR